jgi:hypothetical protein
LRHIAPAAAMHSLTPEQSVIQPVFKDNYFSVDGRFRISYGNIEANIFIS